MGDTIKALKQNKIRGMKSDLMPVAAALGFIDAKAEDKARDIKEIYDYLKTQKGFRWYIGGTKRSLYSILVYAFENMDGDTAALNSVINTTLTNIILDEILMMIILISSTNSSSSSGSK